MTAKCPQCGSSVEQGTLFCLSCGFYLTWADPAEDDPIESTMTRRPGEDATMASQDSAPEPAAPSITAPESALRVRTTADTIEIMPGGTTSLDVMVFNTGKIVDGFAIQATGLDGVDSKAVPDRLSLLPGREGAFHVTLSLPADAPVPAGSHRAGLEVRSLTDPNVVNVVAIDLMVGEAPDAIMSIDPSRARGTREARYQVRVHNHGNVPLSVTLRGHDPTGKLHFSFAPEQLTVIPFWQAGAWVDVAAAATSEQLDHVVSVHAVGAPLALSADATFVQEAVVSPAEPPEPPPLAPTAVRPGGRSKWLLRVQVILVLVLAGIMLLLTGYNRFYYDDRTTLGWAPENTDRYIAPLMVAAAFVAGLILLVRLWSARRDGRDPVTGTPVRTPGQTLLALLGAVLGWGVIVALIIVAGFVLPE